MNPIILPQVGDYPAPLEATARVSKSRRATVNVRLLLPRARMSITAPDGQVAEFDGGGHRPVLAHMEMGLN